MKFDDMVRVSIRQVIRQRRRNMGLMLAIALGVAGFIVVITMGRDVKANFNKDLELLGGATLMRAHFEGYFDNARMEKPEWFREKTVEAVNKIPGVSGASRVSIMPNFAKTIMQKKTMFLQVVGVDGHFWTVNSLKPLAGVFFGVEGVRARAKICVIGEALALKLFKTMDVIGKYLPIDSELFRIVGIMGGLSVGDRDQWAYLPLTTFLDRLDHILQPDNMYIRCRNWNDVQSVSEQVPKVIEANQPVRFLKIEVGWDRLEQVKKTSWWIELFIYVSIGATLGLGGFGIWNTMMIAIRSRTREIGLKKAMGAEDRDILSQFLTEALCISIGAAVFGILLSRAAVEVLAYLLGSRPMEDLYLWCVFLGLLFAAFLGCVAGISPAIRASRMEVVTAISHE